MFQKFPLLPVLVFCRFEGIVFKLIDLHLGNRKMAQSPTYPFAFYSEFKKSTQTKRTGSFYCSFTAPQDSIPPRWPHQQLCRLHPHGNQGPSKTLSKNFCRQIRNISVSPRRRKKVSSRGWNQHLICVQIWEKRLSIRIVFDTKRIAVSACYQSMFVWLPGVATTTTGIVVALISSVNREITHEILIKFIQRNHSHKKHTR